MGSIEPIWYLHKYQVFLARSQETGDRRQETGGKREERREKREEGREKREEGRGKREEGRGKREEGRGEMWVRDHTKNSTHQHQDFRSKLMGEKT
ncbi:hypothetical protein [Okeania sp. SIO1I7]|uniref:hypothetical protein n=1 Tax=Okeania sp. SIO1I7 TaxID=2607772 RepID=UPI0013FAF931|nr:hypothetical protein [Okeania sp. SIO1I7]NET24721.1 hypothetical protein [Okeania sp. SIO1I7]